MKMTAPGPLSFVSFVTSWFFSSLQSQQLHGDAGQLDLGRSVQHGHSAGALHLPPVVHHVAQVADLAIEPRGLRSAPSGFRPAGLGVFTFARNATEAKGA